MTTIAIRDGIMAADTAVFEGAVYAGIISKIVKARDGSLVGASGKAAACWDYIHRAQVESDKPMQIGEDASALIIKPDGSVWCIEAGGPPFRIEGPFHATGPGAGVAIGAMAAGATAEEAVEIACRYDKASRAPVETLRLNERELTEEEKAALQAGMVAFQADMAKMAARTDKWAKRTPAAGYGHRAGEVVGVVPVEPAIKVWSTREETPAERADREAAIDRMVEKKQREEEMERSQRVWSRIFKGLFR